MIASAIQRSMQTSAWPHQHLLSLHPCLGKPGGDYRTICKSPMLYRMALRADSTVRQWEVHTKQEYDTATIGSSALSAALYRNLEMELAKWLGQHALEVYNDFKKFFDTIDIEVLLEEAIAAGFPPADLCLALQQHLAPRVIQANGYSAKPMTIIKSLLAGCKHSVAITRAYLRRTIASIDTDHSECNPKVFVDDISMFARASRVANAVGHIVPGLCRFVELAQRKLKLTISPKSVFVASDDRTSTRFQIKCMVHKLKYKLSHDARDLGVTSKAGRGRPSNLLTNRLTKVRTRINKIKGIAKKSRSAKQLYSGSADAAATCGHQASGISSNGFLQLERDALSCTGISPKGRCRTIALVVTYGVQGTPKARVIRETLRSWFEVLRMASPHILNDIGTAWPKARHVLMTASNPILSVKGIMSNLIYLLLQAKWDPVSFRLWREPDGSEWAIAGEIISADAVAAALIRSFLRLDLKTASAHYNGFGIQDGIDYHNTMNVTRGLSPTSYPYKCALETILAAATWPAERIHEIHPDVDPICPRCGQAVESALHCFWTCPCNAQSEDDEVASTQALIPAAIAKAEDLPCLWLRGILPAKLTDCPPPTPPP